MIDREIYTNKELKKCYKRLDELERLINFVIMYLPNITFKEIKDTNGKYFISPQGIVLSMCYLIPRVLKPQKHHKDKYYYVSINGKKRRIHQLVAETFLPNPENKPLVHHKDFDKLNNELSNLQWLTYAEHNKLHAEHQKQVKESKRLERGENATIQ